MGFFRVVAALWMMIAASACAQAPRAAEPAPAVGTSVAAPAPVRPRGTLRVAWGAEPSSVSGKMQTPGISALSELAMTFNSALAHFDPWQPRPQLALALPTLEDGSWVVRPDGTMTTTYRIRPNAKWHDGAPLTAHDYVFAYEVYTDPEIPVAKRAPENLMARVTASDDYTLVIDWRESFYNAGALRYQQLDPLPRHILEPELADKAKFINLTFWTREFVGSGPFRIERWDPGTGLIARAFDDWVLGPPRIATLEIRFITDPNTILANLLSGDADISAGPWISAATVTSARDWLDSGRGWLSSTESRLQHMDFQYRQVQNWTPAILDVRFRQAFTHALDRQSLAEVANARLGGKAADAFILPTDPGFADVDRGIAKYPYDPTRAAALLTEAGWRRGADSMFVDTRGQPLSFELWSSGGSSSETDAAIMTANLRDAGISASILLMSPARRQDAEYRASFAGGNLSTRPISPENFTWISSHAATVENRWQGSNFGNLRDAEIDSLAGRWLSAIRVPEQREVQAALLQHVTRNVSFVSLYYPVDLIVMSSRLRGPGERLAYTATSWNIFEWELTG